MKNQNTGEVYEVSALRDEATQSTLYEGLPDELDIFTNNFNGNEKWENMREVLECSVTLHAALTIESSDQRQSIMHASTLQLEEQKEMPTAAEF